MAHMLTRRELLASTAMAGVSALTGPSAVAQTPPRRPRIACLVSYWGATRSHADWIITKLIDGYWWQGAHTPSRIEVASVYLHQRETSTLGQKVCKAKGIPIFDTVGDALTLGGKALDVDGVVIVGEHGQYPVDLKGHWLLPRWWMYQQMVKAFEQSGRSVPVFNDKHLSYDWDEAKWMFDKSRELKFALTGGSSIPTYYRTPEIELANDTPITASISLGGAPDEGGFFHTVDVLQSFVERRKGGETGVASVQYIRGPETWAWTERTPWAGRLLEAARTRLSLKPGHFQAINAPNVCVIEYRDGTKAAIYNAREVGWTWAGEIAGQPDPTVVSMLGFPGPFDQYHASNGQPHWIVETMVTRREPFDAQRLLLSTGIVNFALESHWQNGRYSAVGRRVETPFLDMTYRPTHSAQFSTGARPPGLPYIRGFDM
ncbi:hypothetical protein TBR22_A42960 [Luteitalea sp. TBR-22]|nr:hypothetical protein [Luteitalea sp. TBR-22]BCS35070.1 hypothetical protein TBR22_A42960 [Luteitalea sp. TBR-22]